MIIIRSDARQLPIADESVHCVVTSPPYWGLRSYRGGENMIGLEPTFEAHLENLVDVFREVWRVLRPDGTVWLNYGDIYASSSSGGSSPDGDRRGRSDTALAHSKRVIGSGLKTKDLMMMPARVAMALQADGWWVRSEIVWHKPNPMPESVPDRPTSAHEKVFLLSKSGSSLFWTHSQFPGVRMQPSPDYEYRNRDTGVETAVEPSNWRELLSRNDPEKKAWQRVNLWAGHDYFYDAEAVRTANTRGTLARFGSDGSPNYRNGRFEGGDKPETVFSGKGANPGVAGAALRNVWKIPTQSLSEAHFATFPEKLVEPCILAGTSAAGACAKCGAPWVRMVETELVPTAKAAKTFVIDARDAIADSKSQGNNRQKDGHRPGWINKSTTLGWKPTCECEAPKVPCTVLDPFVGSGTTLRVATQLNRRGIGCDLAYQDIAKKRTIRVQRELPIG